MTAITMTMRGVPPDPRDMVRVGFIGVGGRGAYLMGDILAMPDAVVTAVCDRNEAAVRQVIQRAVDRGKPAPQGFSGMEGYEYLLAQDFDLLYIATSWQSHASLAVAAMEAGKHVAVEVPAAITMEECWQLVETSERTRRHCVMLENCCYGYWEMMVIRMARAGLFGTLTHAECAYIHDLRSMFFDPSDQHHWRRHQHIVRDGNLYPTHGLGPVAWALDIGTSDEIDFLVSVSSREAGLSEYRARSLANDDPRRAETYLCGDMNLSILRTRLGRTIVVQHDVVTPRPYDRIFLIAGTHGAFRDYPPRLFLDGKGSHDEWLDPNDYKAEWEDPLWTQQGEIARANGGHGGMDFLMNYRLIQAFRNGTPPDMDVYDAALWSAIGPLSDQSVAARSAPVTVPDFQRR
ncbi:MAG: Gfo/Idh/MocA family oxidoreductase [Capsulimonadales bacterium]|nr:Gfo/Idh/MocA family oxidoreductase [Capsulimonadales bacterium]